MKTVYIEQNSKYPDHNLQQMESITQENDLEYTLKHTYVYILVIKSVAEST